MVHDHQCGRLCRASFDFSRLQQLDTSAADSEQLAYVRLSPVENSRVLAAVSPITHVTLATPPTCLIHGDADDIVPLQQSEVLAERLRTAGVECELFVKPGAGHPWPNFWAEDQHQALVSRG